MHKSDTKGLTVWPVFKMAAEMSKICGIGENRLRQMMDNGEIEYLQVGNKRLLTVRAVLDYYERNKVAVRNISEQSAT